jgi:hypothetical protein
MPHAQYEKRPVPGSSFHGLLLSSRSLNVAADKRGSSWQTEHYLSRLSIFLGSGWRHVDLGVLIGDLQNLQAACDTAEDVEAFPDCLAGDEVGDEA